MANTLPQFARAIAALLSLTALTVTAPAPAMSQPATPDPYLWLEDVQGERALDWVRARNAVSQKELQAVPQFGSIKREIAEVLNAKDRIPAVTRRGDWFYNFWQDETNKRGLWRRTTLAEYRKAAPAWETVLDLDELGRSEGENWVWGGATSHGPSHRKVLVSLSRGGADAKVVREFDAVEKRFVKDGFTLPEAKSSVDWIDDDTLFVATDFGPGSLTDSGYPRVVKRWKRGTPLASAETAYAGETKDVSVGVMVDHTPGFERTLFYRATDFFHQQFFLQTGKALVKVDVPDDATLDFMRDTLLLHIRSDLKQGDTTFPAGSLLQGDATAYLAGERKLAPLFTPTATRSLDGYVTTRDHVLVNVMDNVANRIEQWTKSTKGGSFTSTPVEAPFPGTLGLASLHDPELKDDALANAYFLTYTDFLTPESLFMASAGKSGRDLLKSRSALFDATGMRVEQRFVASKDGTRVPYFIVWPKGATADGTNPTLLYGYGGFEVSMNPGYSGAVGRSWLARGGVHVVANIRGGGEYGPKWHQSALKANRQRAYDDFIAVAEDLIKQKITSPRHLGIQGGSNGGLLVGATFVQRPDLFNAVLCAVPLLDMQRYHLLLAGASWMAEYGNPDLADEWAYISRYSPYQNVKADAKYPKVMFATSTRDDRVHPGHARKMAARMLAQGHALLYYENIEGGHGGAADNDQKAHLKALEYAYLWEQLGR